MSLEADQYVYSFEIENILKQFFAIIDKAVVLRYNKTGNERELVQTITPYYKFATKSRVLLLSMNNAKNFTLPCVAVSITGITGDKERLAAKNNMIKHYRCGILEGYYRPTPITISVSLSIITKLVTDLYQIYGKLCTQFQPEVFYSWAVPTNAGIISGIEELRNKVEWDFNLVLESKERITENDEDRYIGKMNFNIQSWMFPSERQCQNVIYDIGSSIIVTDELEKRIDLPCPAVSEWLGVEGNVLYENPREFSNAHVRILNAFSTAKNFNYRIGKNNNNVFNITDKENYITFDGYNLSRAKALFVPKKKMTKKLGNIVSFEYDTGTRKIWPVIGESQSKFPIIKGYELEVVSQSDNLLTVKIGKMDYKGTFDVVLYDEVDYDSLNKAKGIELIAC